MKLTFTQQKAIEHDGRNLQLIACAGSGKTEVVARRVVHLLTPGRVNSLVPANIVAFTFTEKAAAACVVRLEGEPNADQVCVLGFVGVSAVHRTSLCF